MEKTILHADGNCFYASVEMKYNPALRRVPLAVGGDEEARHGIVLAKNDIAKRFKIQTGEALVVARQKCPGLVVVPARHKLYMEHAQMMRELFFEYTDQVEAFGLDECWLDVTHSLHLFGSGEHIADTLRQRAWKEIGITLSVGVSFNKIFAKLGSDMKKPDATTVVTRENYKQKVWSLPVGDLLNVGPATREILRKCHIATIGQLAKTSPAALRGLLGKWGHVLWIFANGEDPSPVARFDAKPVIKSVGNSSTTPHDLRTEQDVKITLYLMSESVAARLREYGYRRRTVQICVRGNDLSWYQRQAPLPFPSQDSEELFKVAWRLYRQHKSHNPIRSLGVRASNLIDAAVTQWSMLPDTARVQRHEELERTVDSLRERFGHFAIQRGIMLADPRLAGVNPREDHLIFPVSYFR